MIFYHLHTTLLTFSFFFLLIPPPPRSTLFPYTTLFRSHLFPEDPERHVGVLLDCAQVAEVVQRGRSEEHTSELQSQSNLVCRLLLEKKKKKYKSMCLVLIHRNE